MSTVQGRCYPIVVPGHRNCEELSFNLSPNTIDFADSQQRDSRQPYCFHHGNFGSVARFSHKYRTPPEIADEPVNLRRKCQVYGHRFGFIFFIYQHLIHVYAKKTSVLSCLRKEQQKPVVANQLPCFSSQCQ